MENQYSWFVVYTSSRAEKKVKERLDEAGIENYLPLKTEIRVWSDRKKKITSPLIPGYIFVRVLSAQFLDVLNVGGVVAFLREKSVPAPIPEDQMFRLRFMVEEGIEDIEFTTDLVNIGDKVLVKQGKLSGLIGELVEIRGKYKVAIRLNYFGCALITVPISCVEKIV